jgi:NAD(P)H-hydrate epimerase
VTIEDLPAVAAMPSVTAAQMAEIDRAAVEELGISIHMLMENAARQIAIACRAVLGSVEGRRIVCLAGTGNNGGDALAAARRLHGWGADVRCVLASPPDALHGELNTRQHDILGRIGVALAQAEEARLESAELLVDGLLGYSVRGAPRGNVELLIREADRSRVPIVAVDLPSGLDPDSGQPLGIAIRAAVTVTLALPKVGLVSTASRSLVGELLLADIGIPPVAYERFGIDARRCFVDGDLVRVVGT